MKKRSLSNYSQRYLYTAVLLIIALWAALFYAFITEEVYDNIDDGLKNTKIQIVREAFHDSTIRMQNEFGVNHFKITPVPTGNYPAKNTLYNSKMYMEYDDDYEPVRILKTYFRDNHKNYYELIIYASVVEEDELAGNLLIALAVLYLTIVGSILVINKLLLQKVWHPFRKVLAALKTYRFGNKETFPIIDSPIIEFNELNKGIAKMANRNNLIFQQQKQFIENVSHELQTPLAIAVNQLELLMESGNMQEKELQQISDVIENLLRINRFNKSLLTLSKIENEQFIQEEKIAVNSIIEDLLSSFEDLIRYFQLRVHYEQQEVFYCIMNKELALILFTNLVKNAILHNHNQGFISIKITSQSIIIENSSDKNSPLNLNLLYNRFYKESKHAHSSGLGMAIVKSITDTSMHIALSYSFNNSLHQFTILNQQKS